MEENIKIDKKDIIYKDIDAYLYPDDITILCHEDHDITIDKRFICNKDFIDILKKEKILKVACGDETHHICSKCYEKLFKKQIKFI